MMVRPQIRRLSVMAATMRRARSRVKRDMAAPQRRNPDLKVNLLSLATNGG
jgi:hypothetical protein